MKIINEIFNKYDLNEVVKNRFDIEFIVDCKNGNPNGDPDADNLPRIDEETAKGYITDVCFKNKIRQYILTKKNNEEHYNIYIDNSIALNEQHLKAYTSLGIKPDKNLPKDEQKAKELQAFMTSNFYDVRTFGAVMSTEVNCGTIRGPVQFSFGYSIDPISTKSITITRRAVTKESDRNGTNKNKVNEMGNKTLLHYGAYRCSVYISASDAEKTNFTYGDLKLLIEAIYNMYEVDRAAARGECATQMIVVYEHASKLGDAPAHKLFKSVKIEKNTEYPRCFEDYDVFIESIDDLSDGKVTRHIID